MRKHVGDMSSERDEKQINESKQEAEPVRQQSPRDMSRLDKVASWYNNQNSFDKIAFYLVSAVFLIFVVIFIADFLILDVQENMFHIFVASIATVFTLLSVRESKRDREGNVAPTLVVGKTDEGEYGILNLGEGPAHELSARVATDRPDDWGDIEPEKEGEILRVGGFLPIDGEPDWVKMEYRSNVGKKYNYTREVLPNDN